VRLADLPTQFEQERAEARRRNKEAHERIAREKRRVSSRKVVRLANNLATITWIDPVYIGGIPVIGIASDASSEVKREYGVML
jgi:hypothetical protein